MTRCTIELEPEVRDWLEGLSTTHFAAAAFYVDGQAVRVTYWIATGCRVILLTVFRKTRMRERREVDRARRALRRCVIEAHAVDEVRGSERDDRAH